MTEPAPHQITITCPCGTRYDSPRQQFHKCPRCGHVWDLSPKDDGKGAERLAQRAAAIAASHEEKAPRV